MANIKFTIPLLPGIATLNVAEISLPVEKMVGKFLRSSAKPVLAGDFVAWCLRKILEDQYIKDNARGGWSKRYSEYGKFIFGDDNMYESLTVSGCVAEALVQYNKKFLNDSLTKGILPRLLSLKDFLKRRYNVKEGGFGLPTARPKRDERGISVKIRHTAWSVIALWYLQDLGVRDQETDKMLRIASGYIQKNLSSLNTDDEYALTYAVLHKILTTNTLADLVISPKKRRQGVLKTIEGILVDKFVLQYGSWDRDDVIKHPKVRIDNALSVLGPIQISSCIDSGCSEVLKTALNHLCEKSLRPAGDKMMALPYYEGGDPDIGATIELLWCIIKNQDVFKPKKGIVKKMMNFIVDPSNRKDNLRFAYPWNLSSALFLATKSE